MGEYYTEFYDELPSLTEILKDIKEHLRAEKIELENKLLSAREENYLEVLERIIK